MNIILVSLTTLAALYIVVSAIKYAFRLVFTSSIVIVGSTLANHYGGQSAALLILIISPVLYIAIPDSVGTLKSVLQVFSGLIFQPLTRFFLYFISLFAVAPKAYSLVQAGPRSLNVIDNKTLAEVEDQPLKGEWISGKTPQLTFSQIKIGDVKALPRPWL